METQWPRHLHAVRLCAGLHGTLGSIFHPGAQGPGQEQMTALITSAVSLVVERHRAFLHPSYWERIFNGFRAHHVGHHPGSSSDAWRWPSSSSHGFVVLRALSFVPKALAWATLAVAVLMMVATAHSYLMPARPREAWRSWRSVWATRASPEPQPI